MQTIKALVVGCGNIGAGYDFDNPNTTQTHARAFSKHKHVHLFFADTNGLLAQKAARQFGGHVFDSNDGYSNFDIISLATPTSSHSQYLHLFLKNNIPVVICEKPIADSIYDLQGIESAYKNSTTKVLVNYIRRFQPAFHNLKAQLDELKTVPDEITVKYHRGFLNNASHAIDLLEFLFETKFNFDDFKVDDFAFEAFPKDPTLSGTGFLLGRPVNFLAFPDNEKPIFEIEIKVKTETISILDRGDTIRFSYSPEKISSGILTHYMDPIINRALNLLFSDEEDNFSTSLELNSRTLAFIQKNFPV